MDCLQRPVLTTPRSAPRYPSARRRRAASLIASGLRPSRLQGRARRRAGRRWPPPTKSSRSRRTTSPPGNRRAGSASSRRLNTAGGDRGSPSATSIIRRATHRHVGGGAPGNARRRGLPRPAGVCRVSFAGPHLGHTRWRPTRASMAVRGDPHGAMAAARRRVGALVAFTAVPARSRARRGRPPGGADAAADVGLPSWSRSKNPGDGRPP